MVCENQKYSADFCPATGILNIDKANKDISISGQHNRLPPLVHISMTHLRRDIGLAAIQCGRISDSDKYITMK